MSTPVGPYSPAMRAGPWLVCSGQIGIEQGPDGPALVAGGFEAQARIDALLRSPKVARDLRDENGEDAEGPAS